MTQFCLFFHSVLIQFWLSLDAVFTQFFVIFLLNFGSITQYTQIDSAWLSNDSVYSVLTQKLLSLSALYFWLSLKCFLVKKTNQNVQSEGLLDFLKVHFLNFLASRLFKSPLIKLSSDLYRPLVYLLLGTANGCSDWKVLKPSMQIAKRHKSSGVCICLMFRISVNC